MFDLGRRPPDKATHIFSGLSFPNHQLALSYYRPVIDICVNEF